MGELSKKIGEKGEALVLAFLRTLGWSDPVDGLQIACLHSRKHALSGRSERNSHGVDLLYRHQNPLEDRYAENIVVSVKFSDDAYPSSPASKFKTHSVDLIQTLDCFSRSKSAQSLNEIFSSRIARTTSVGVLLWLNTSRDSDQSFIAKVAKCQFPDELKFDRFYVVDNRRASFIYDSIQKAESIFKGKTIAFHYNSIAQNHKDQNIKLFGRVMPTEYLCAPIIPFRVIDPTTNTHTLCLSYDGEFEKETFSMILSYARSICSDFTQNFTVIFNGFNEIQDRNESNEVIQSLNELSNNYEVKVFDLDRSFRSLLNG